MSDPTSSPSQVRLLALLVALVASLFPAQSTRASVYVYDVVPNTPILPVGATGTTVYSSTGENVAITDNGYTGSLSLPSMACKSFTVLPDSANTIVGPVSISVRLTHTRVGNLVVKLRAPGGAIYTLMSRPGYIEPDDSGSTDNAGDNSNLLVTSPITFSMAAATEAEQMGSGLNNNESVCADGGPCSFNPDAGLSGFSDNLQTLNNTQKNGTWDLCVGDAATNDSGFLGNWTLNLGAVTDTASDGDCDAGTSGTEVLIPVPAADSYTVTSIALGLNISHTLRGDVRATLVAPDNSHQVFAVQDLTDDNDNYDVMISTTSDPSGVALNDGDLDPLAEPLYHRMVTLAGANFYSGPANGDWRLRLCDRDNNGTSGELESARLVLSDASGATQVCSNTVSLEWCSSPTCNGQLFPGVGIPAGGITMTQTAVVASPAGAGPGAQNFRTQNNPSAGGGAENVLGGESGYFFNNFNDSDVAPNNENILFGSSWHFSQPVRDLTWRILDNDRSSGGAPWEDISRSRAAYQGLASPWVAVLGADQQRAGDFIEADGENYDPAQAGANIGFRFNRAVSDLDVGYWAGDDFVPSQNQYIGFGNPTFCVFDFGDAPDSFGTTLGALLPGGGARHVLANRLVYLGANPPDGEAEGRPSADASDDNDLAPNLVGDEDGVVGSFPNYVAGSGTYSVTVSATNTSASNATLVGFIDWNGNNVFDNDTNEESAPVPVNSPSRLFGDAPEAQSFVVTWNSVPANPGTAARFARFRISTDAAAAALPTGLAPDGEVEDYQIPAGTLPVTVAWVETARERGGLAVRFMTSSENQNVGFRIWGVDARGERTLLGRIPSKVVDSFAPQSYELRVAGANVAAVEIEDVGAHGRNRLHGPFEVGSVVGERPEGAAIDWSAIRAENARTEAEAREAATRSAVDLLADAAIGGGPTGPTSVALVRVREAGLHRLTYEQLLAAGIDLAATNSKASRLALYDRGVAIPRYVSSPSEIFGPGAYIEFLVRPQLTLASPFDALELRVDRRDTKNLEARPAAGGLPEVTQAEVLGHPDRAFSPSAPNGDPWYDARLLSFGAPVQVSRSFDLPDLADGPVELTVQAWGYIYFDGVAPDHHIVVRLNGTEIASESFDGLTPWDGTFDVADLVQETGNTLEIVVPGDTGYSADLINLEGFSVAYDRATVALDGRFRGRPVAGGAPYAVDGFADGPVIAWVDSAGRPTRTELTAVAGRVTVADPSAEAFLAQPNRMLTPEIVAGVPTALASRQANYLIITHPLFADSLGDLVALEQSRGFSTAVVTVDRIYAAYGDHAPSAEAIRRFVAASSRTGQLRYVLLVGADSSDPYDHLGLGSISFVPTAYLPVVTDVSFSPTDEAIADTNGDGFPDVPIGRLPVRTAAELSNAVAKLYAWDQSVVGSASALMCAGASDAPGELPSINQSYADALNGWSKSLAEVDSLGLATVRQQVLAGMNAGVPVVSFVGHSSPGQWDFTPILRWQDVGSFANAGRPNLVTQWGCWNSYYVEPGYECMSGRLLRTQDVGAAGTIGASTLTSDASHRRLGVLFFQEMTRKSMRLGDAFLAAKRVLRTEGGAQDAILGMALLGDPAMPLPYAPPAP